MLEDYPASVVPLLYLLLYQKTQKTLANSALLYVLPPISLAGEETFMASAGSTLGPHTYCLLLSPVSFLPFSFSRNPGISKVFKAFQSKTFTQFLSENRKNRERNGPETDQFLALFAHAAGARSISQWPFRL